MAAFFGAIADDFTGATDLAGLLARSGARVSLRIGVPDTPAEDPAGFEVIAMKIRTNPVADAQAQAVKGLNWLREAGAQQFYWKYCSTFDSTPQGNIGPVAEAMMAQLDVPQTIYCPAFPENGRSIFMGNLFVGQQPLAESPMKDHPLTPMRDSNLMRLLEPQVTGKVGLISRLVVANGAAAIREELAQLKARGVAHVIVDAVADEDLGQIATACWDLGLMTGGSALAMPLPEIYRAAGHMGDQAEQVKYAAPHGRGLILSGSCSAMTQAQVQTYANDHASFQLDPRDLVKTGVQPGLDWLAGQDGAPLIYATAAPDAVRAIQAELGTEKAGEIVEEAMAAIAIAARDMGFTRLVVAGGETSGAVTQALGVQRLDVGPEVAPGVPWCFAQSAGVSIALALKSGNFGDPQFFSTALTTLENL